MGWMHAEPSRGRPGPVLQRGAPPAPKGSTGRQKALGREGELVISKNSQKLVINSFLPGR